MVSNPVWEICERVAEPQTFETRPTSDKFKGLAASVFR
jgi:hypothetical protein